MLYFADGRPFADLDRNTGTSQSNRICDDDRCEIATLVRSRNIEQERLAGLRTIPVAMTTSVAARGPRSPDLVIDVLAARSPTVRSSTKMRWLSMTLRGPV